MAVKPLNSVAGFSVGEYPTTTIIAANGDVSTNNFSTTGTANLNAVGNVKITGGSAGQYLQTDGSGNLSFSTISTSSIVNGNSNVNIPTANGNVNITAVGNTTVVVTGTGVNVAGTGNFTGNVSALGLLTDNIYYANGQPWDLQEAAGSNNQIQYNIGNNFAASANFTYNDTTQVLTVTGNILGSNIYANSGTIGANVVNGNLVGGTLTTAAQPNVTSLGNLTGLTVGNATSNVVISNAGTVTSTGNITAPYFIGNVQGNISGNIVVPGSNTDVIFNNEGNAGASNAFTFNKSSNVLTLSGNLISGNVYANSGTIGAQTLKGEGGNISNIQGANVSGTVSSATTAGTVTTAAQPNITSTGVLSNLYVANTIYADGYAARTGSDLTLSTAGNGNLIINTAGTGITDFSGKPVSNISNLSATGTLSVTGNANVGNIGATAGVFTATVTAGNVYANSGIIGAQTLKGEGGNISNIAGANVSGTVANANYAAYAGNVTTAAQPNITSVGTLSSLDVTGNITSSANVVTDFVVGKTGSITIAASGSNQDVEIKPTGTGAVDVWSARIANVADPTQAQDAATKAYVDAAVTGLHVHDSCYVATTTTLDTASGGTVSYNNGTGGVGATLTTTGTYLLIDGGNVQTAGTRILVKNEANAAWNGIYTYTSTTVLTRAADFDTSAEAAGGDFVFVTSGSTQADTGWVQTTDNPTLGTSPIVWTQFSGAGTYTAGTGLTLTGTVFSISNTTVSSGSYGSGDAVATFTVNAQGQLTAAANTAITANAANLTGTTLASTVVTSSLTSVGTLGSLAVTGNITSGNVYANSGTIGANLLTGTLTTAAQPNVTSVGTLTSLSVTGNVSSGNISATTANLTTANVTGNVIIGSSTTSAATLTTTTTSSNQTIASFPVSGVTGVEFLVKGIDSTGSKYTVATVQAVTDGTNVDYTIFGGVTLGGFTGTLSVAVASGDLKLQVTPSSSNSTVWTTQYRFI